MNRHDPAVPSPAASTTASGDLPAPVASFARHEQVSPPVCDAENWLGYESIHPLTWVPGSSAP